MVSTFLMHFTIFTEKWWVRGLHPTTYFLMCICLCSRIMLSRLAISMIIVRLLFVIGARRFSIRTTFTSKCNDLLAGKLVQSYFMQSKLQNMRLKDLIWVLGGLAQCFTMQHTQSTSYHACLHRCVNSFQKTSRKFSSSRFPNQFRDYHNTSCCSLHPLSSLGSRL
jgi:hypothetical protein